MNAKEMLEKWKLEGGHKTYRELAKSLNVALGTLDTWKLRNEIPAKYILKYQKNIQNESKEITINFYENVTASAGYGIASMENKPKKMAFDSALLQGLKIQNRNNLDIIKISGDSMLPYFNDGDLIIVERECEAKNGDTIIANIAGDLYVKQLEKDPFNKWVRLVSTNKDYGSILLEGQEVESLNIIGIVRARINVRVY